MYIKTGKVKHMETKVFNSSDKSIYFLMKQSKENGNYKAKLYKFNFEDDNVKLLRTKTRMQEKDQICITRESERIFSKLKNGRNYRDFEIVEQLSENDFFRLRGCESPAHKIALKTFEIPKNIFGWINFQDLSPLAKKYVRKIGSMLTKIK